VPSLWAISGLRESIRHFRLLGGSRSVSKTKDTHLYADRSPIYRLSLRSRIFNIRIYLVETRLASAETSSIFLIFVLRGHFAIPWTAVAAKPLSQIPTAIDFDTGAFPPPVVPMFDSSPSYNLFSRVSVRLHFLRQYIPGGCQTVCGDFTRSLYRFLESSR
jgi:hypothetical protein